MSTSRRAAQTQIAPDLRRLATPIAGLCTDPANARHHGPESIQAIAASLQRFGQTKPIVVDETGATVAGAGVLEAAKSLGWTHVAAVRFNGQGIDRAAYAIADNRIAELSTWDPEALDRLLQALPPEARDVTGWTQAQLDKLKKDAGLVQEDAVPAPLPTAVTKPGDVWILGDKASGHRILCGDSTSAADVDRVLAGDVPELVQTDPPYVVEYTGERLNDNGKDWSNLYREIDIPDALEFYRAVFAQVVRVMRPGAAVYCWHAHRRIVELKTAWAEAGLLDHQTIIWAKPIPVMGHIMWPFRHEPCLMGWLAGHRPKHDGSNLANSVWDLAPGGLPVGEGEPTREQLLELVRLLSDCWAFGWEGGKSRVTGNEHPTQKPVEIFARPMRRHTRPGDVVFEPFSGSGTQIIAAEQLKRRCRAIEIQPVFVDVAVRRWQALTGKQAVHEKTGRTWEQTRIGQASPARAGAAPVSSPKASTSRASNKLARSRTSSPSRPPGRSTKPKARSKARS